MDGGLPRWSSRSAMQPLSARATPPRTKTDGMRMMTSVECLWLLRADDGDRVVVDDERVDGAVAVDIQDLDHRAGAALGEGAAAGGEAQRADLVDHGDQLV